MQQRKVDDFSCAYVAQGGVKSGQTTDDTIMGKIFGAQWSTILVEIVFDADDVTQIWQRSWASASRPCWQSARISTASLPRECGNTLSRTSMAVLSPLVNTYQRVFKYVVH